jgi:multidrug resistance efflux pump
MPSSISRAAAQTDAAPAASGDRGSPAGPVFFGLCAGLVIAAWVSAEPVHRAHGVCQAERRTVTLDRAARIDDVAVHDGEIVSTGQPLLHWTDLALHAEIARRERLVEDLSGRLAAADARYDAELSRRMSALDQAIRSQLADGARKPRGGTIPVALATTNQPADRLAELRRQRLELPAGLRTELKIPTLRWELVAAEASLAELRGKSVRKTLFAPTAGTVELIDVRSGAELPTGGWVISQSIPSRPQILAELPAAEARELDVGDRVEVIVEDGRARPATITELRPGRHIAGTRSAAADPEFVTARIIPCDCAEWPAVRDGSPVSITW